MSNSTPEALFRKRAALALGTHSEATVDRNSERGACLNRLRAILSDESFMTYLLKIVGKGIRYSSLDIPIYEGSDDVLRFFFNYDTKKVHFFSIPYDLHPAQMTYFARHDNLNYQRLRAAAYPHGYNWDDDIIKLMIEGWTLYSPAEIPPLPHRGKIFPGLRQGLSESASTRQTRAEMQKAYAGTPAWATDLMTGEVIMRRRKKGNVESYEALGGNGEESESRNRLLDEIDIEFVEDQIIFAISRA